TSQNHCLNFFLLFRQVDFHSPPELFYYVIKSIPIVIKMHFATIDTSTSTPIGTLICPRTSRFFMQKIKPIP
ncbi:MAG: hypothetical protein ACTSYG_03445, partial [Candidatus Heimdallarchaeota archaeon]